MGLPSASASSNRLAVVSSGFQSFASPSSPAFFLSSPSQISSLRGRLKASPQCFLLLQPRRGRGCLVVHRTVRLIELVDPASEVVRCGDCCGGLGLPWALGVGAVLGVGRCETPAQAGDLLPEPKRSRSLMLLFIIPAQLLAEACHALVARACGGSGSTFNGRVDCKINK